MQHEAVAKNDAAISCDECCFITKADGAVSVPRPIWSRVCGENAWRLLPMIPKGKLNRHVLGTC